MSNDLKEEAKVLLKDVYADGAKPAVTEFGKIAALPLRAISSLLSPIHKLVYRNEADRAAYEKVMDAQVQAVERETVKALEARQVPAERFISPSLHIAGPILENFQFATSTGELRSMYAALLATAMDSDTAHKAHPAFVQVVKQLTPDEAKIVRLFGKVSRFPSWQATSSIIKDNPENPALGITVRTVEVENLYLMGHDAGCEHLDLVPIYADNLIRLGLANLTSYEMPVSITSLDNFFNVAEGYQDARFSELPAKHPEVIGLFNKVFKTKARSTEQVYPNTTYFHVRYLRVTPFGQMFYKACIADEQPLQIEAEMPTTPP